MLVNSLVVFVYIIFFHLLFSQTFSLICYVIMSFYFQAKRMVKEIKKEFSSNLDNVDWMSDNTKKKAKLKVSHSFQFPIYSARFLAKETNVMIYSLLSKK